MPLASLNRKALRNHAEGMLLEVAIPASENRCSSPAPRWQTVPGAGPHMPPCFLSTKCHRRSSWDRPGLT
ncbi:hypothetical protein VAPA_2c09460 [Variovorax paradoxus B4]|uniref:Uncharacterized protein n=1 Tax=Variovorax paradoxus B4 TaxID=1246301 RepID=T1XKU0_VARPD|nr:hypothetical protein VAPA_2c09460 [Variovorax paradoxus B4]